MSAHKRTFPFFFRTQTKGETHLDEEVTGSMKSCSRSFWISFSTCFFMRNGNLFGFWTHDCTEWSIGILNSKFCRAPTPSEISLYSRKRLLSLYLKSELVNPEICSYLVSWRTGKTQSNSDVDCSLSDMKCCESSLVGTVVINFNITLSKYR